MYFNGFDKGRELLKWLAIITMTIDHIGAFLYPELEFLRWIGRIAFPLFAYLLVLGLENTTNVRNYFIRLLVFGIISQLPYSLVAIDEPFQQFNIFFTLAFGLLFLYYFKKASPLALVPVALSLVFNFEYNVYGLALIGSMHVLTKNVKLGSLMVVLLSSLFLVPLNNQFLAVLALPLVVLHSLGYLTPNINYSEEFKIPLWRKYFFYIYYPAHLTLFYFIQQTFFAA